MLRTRFVPMLIALCIGLGFLTAAPASAADGEPRCGGLFGRDCSARDWYRDQIKKIDSGDKVTIAAVVVTIVAPYGKDGAQVQETLIKSLSQGATSCVQGQLREIAKRIAVSKAVQGFTKDLAGTSKIYNATKAGLVLKGIQIARDTNLLIKAGFFTIRQWSTFTNGIAQFAERAMMVSFKTSSFGCLRS